MKVADLSESYILCCVQFFVR